MRTGSALGFDGGGVGWSAWPSVGAVAVGVVGDAPVVELVAARFESARCWPSRAVRAAAAPARVAWGRSEAGGGDVVVHGSGSWLPPTRRARLHDRRSTANLAAPLVDASACRRPLTQAVDSPPEERAVVDALAGGHRARVGVHAPVGAIVLGPPEHDLEADPVSRRTRAEPGHGMPGLVGTDDEHRAARFGRQRGDEILLVTGPPFPGSSRASVGRLSCW